MPQLKTWAGHTSTVKKSIEYFTIDRKDGGQRHMDADYFNCCEVDGLGLKTWEQMDQTRITSGNNTYVGGGKNGKGKARTYQNFLISPDPKDEIELAELRELTCSWVEKHFADYEVAIYYHNDNENRIPHAHIIVNNTNIRTGKRLRQPNGWYTEIDKDLQEMAKERGLSYFVNDDPNELRKSTKKTVIEGLEDRGEIPWVEDIRARLQTAFALSRTKEDFLEECAVMGLRVQETESERYGKQWLFVHPQKETWKVTSRRLGSQWSEFSVSKRLATSRAKKPSLEQVERINNALVEFDLSSKMSVSLLGLTDKGRFSAKDVASMLDIAASYDIQSINDFRDVLRTEALAPGQRKRVREAQELAQALWCYSKNRPKSAGKRMSTKTRHIKKNKQKRVSSTTTSVPVAAPKEKPRQTPKRGDRQ